MHRIVGATFSGPVRKAGYAAIGILKTEHSTHGVLPTRGILEAGYQTVEKQIPHEIRNEIRIIPHPPSAADAVRDTLVIAAVETNVVDIVHGGAKKIAPVAFRRNTIREITLFGG